MSGQRTRKLVIEIHKLITLVKYAFHIIWEACLSGRFCVTSLLENFVLQILEYCSPVWGSAAECHLPLLERQVYSVAKLCPYQSFLSLCHRRLAVGLWMLYKVNSNSNHCLFVSSQQFYQSSTSRAAAPHPLVFVESPCWTSQFAWCFLPAQVRMWNDLHDLQR